MPNPVPDVPLTFQLNDGTVATATTDENGGYSVQVPVNLNPGLVQERTMFAGQGKYLPSNSPYQNFQVTPSQVPTVLTAVVTPDTVEQGGTITISGTLMTA